MDQEFRFEAHHKCLSEVLFSQWRFRVPRYQRPYSWDLDQAAQFLQDLTHSEEPYFLGTFIFNTESLREEGFVDIIDGQQRLITATILLAVLRDLAKGLDENTARLFQRQDIAIEDREGRESFRVLPADTLADFLANHIQAYEASPLSANACTAEERRVKQVYKYFYDKVATDLKHYESREKQLGTLKRIRNTLANLVIISVEIFREEDAYEIFETTNARGLELSVADLLKNLIFKKIRSEEDRDLAKDFWQEIISNIESTETELKKFIRYFWVSRYGFVSEKRLFREIKNQITDWPGLLSDLRDDSVWFNRLLEGDRNDFQDLRHDNRVFNSIYALRWMRVSQCYVLLLAILRNYKKLGTDPVTVFELIEKFTFQYSVVCKLPTNRIERLYSRYAIELEHIVQEKSSGRISERVQSLFSKLKKDLIDEAPSKAIFVDSFLDLSHRDTEEGRRLSKYILDRINTYYQRTDEQAIDFDTVNIEHVLPRNPHADWGLTKRQIKSYVDKLGNLTLLSNRLNSQAQNSPLHTKLIELRKSVLPINRNLVEFIESRGERWGEQEINERQKQIAHLAFDRIWAIQ